MQDVLVIYPIAKTARDRMIPGVEGKSLAEFAANAANKGKIIFGRGMYVDKNTSQAASVEFVR